MASTIINIVLVLIIIIPMLYFMIGKKGNKNVINEFKSKAKDAGVNPDRTGTWQNGVFGIDSTQSKFCYISHLKDDDLHVVDLKEVKHCEVSKVYQTESVHSQDISMLKSVSVNMKTAQKTEIIIPVYNASKNLQIGDDLLDAIDMVKMINAKISTYA